MAGGTPQWCVGRRHPDREAKGIRVANLVAKRRLLIDR